MTMLRFGDEDYRLVSACKEEIGRHLGFLIAGECEMKELLNSEDLEVHISKEEEHRVSVEHAVRTSLRDTGDSKRGKRSHSEYDEE